MDFAKRVSDNLHYDMDPIVRSRMDNDFYKLAMGQVIDHFHPEVRVRFGGLNRTRDVRLAEIIPIEAMREQLDHAQTLRYRPNELIWLQGQTFYGVEGLFSSAYINTKRLSRLPDYELEIDKESGQFLFSTEGRWSDVSDWEIPYLAIQNELYAREIMKKMTASELDIMYARAKTKLYAKLERIKERPGITLSEFGTRRRHSFLWQEWVIDMMIDVLGDQFVGTSNSYHAMTKGIEAKGTNAHELPMVYAAIAAAKGSDEDVRESQYDVLQNWQHIYGTHLRVFLPDTFGTTQFLKNAPSWIQWWKGSRPDSKDPIEAGEEMIEFWRHMGADPRNKICLFSDGLDVQIDGHEPNGSDMVAIHDAMGGRISDTYGWGTMATNDFLDCPPGRPTALKPLSLVCKVQSVNGRPAVKLSDNPAKATSPSKDEIERYKKIFGVEGVGEGRETKV